MKMTKSTDQMKKEKKDKKDKEKDKKTQDECGPHDTGATTQSMEI
jgi:hypothetical protein